ncbi:hypothetical protein CB1_000849047 [Camelus ferus]|nr:hypothetical protein CB1_000849047 [Camelus ferus]
MELSWLGPGRSACLDNPLLETREFNQPHVRTRGHRLRTRLAVAAAAGWGRAPSSLGPCARAGGGGVSNAKSDKKPVNVEPGLDHVTED